jgi:hypothetical protein
MNANGTSRSTVLKSEETCIARSKKIVDSSLKISEYERKIQDFIIFAFC